MSVIGDNKAEIGLMAVGGVAGGLYGNHRYKTSPSKMVSTITREGVTQEYITPKFIKYVKKSRKKELFKTIDPHTSRKYFQNQLDAINILAKPAIKFPTSNERYHFQDMYVQGKKFLTNRSTVDPNKLDKAKEGAQAILYGNKAERRGSIAKFAAIGAIICLAGKKISDLISYMKENNASPEDLFETAKEKIKDKFTKDKEES